MLIKGKMSKRDHPDAAALRSNIGTRDVDTRQEIKAMSQGSKKVEFKGKLPSTEIDAEACLNDLAVIMMGQNHLEWEIIEPEEFPNPEMKSLSSRYRVPTDGKTFFVRGRVFSLLFHESAYQSRNPEPEKSDVIDPRISIGPYNQKIFSHIRRMVVIRSRHGYCWCIAINSYGGQGVKKRGFNSNDIKAHTIIYDAQGEPSPTRGEPKMEKEPIAVDLRPGQSLTKASRLNYDQPFMVQWNTRVMDVGTVSRLSMPALMVDMVEVMFRDSLEAQK